MRTRNFPPIALAFLGVALAAAPAGAQARLFRDSWFWGVKGGVVTFSTAASSSLPPVRVTAPSAGGEWLITRTQGALYVAFDQAFFTTTSFVPDASTPSGDRRVEAKDLRRFSLALMAFPKSYGALRPYLGAGVGINLMGKVSPSGSFSDAGAKAKVVATINERKSGASPTLIAGVHMEMRRVSLFGQASLVTFTDKFILNGSSPVGAEFGIRYNLAPAKERPKAR